jgi:hypothetical protein
MGAEKGVAMRPGSAIAIRPCERRSLHLRRVRGVGTSPSVLAGRASVESMGHGAPCEGRRPARMVSSGLGHDAR